MLKLLLKVAAILAGGVVALFVLIVGVLYVVSSHPLPDARLVVGKLAAIVERSEKCWEGCHVEAEGRLTYRGDAVGARLLPGLGNDERVFLHQVLLFPKRRMLVTRLSASNGGAIIAGIEDAGTAPRLRVLAGSIERGKQAYVRDGADPRLAVNALERSGLGAQGNPDFYDGKAGYSFHGRFWIDYAREEVHPVAKPGDAGEGDPVGLSADRKTLFLLHRQLSAPHDYLLCGASGPDGAAQCAMFQAALDTLPDLPRGLDTAKAPVPAIEVHLRDGGQRAAALAAWLAPLFVLDRVGPDGEILARPGTQVLRRMRLPLARDPAEGE